MDADRWVEAVSDAARTMARLIVVRVEPAAEVVLVTPDAARVADARDRGVPLLSLVRIAIRRVLDALPPEGLRAVELRFVLTAWASEHAAGRALIDRVVREIRARPAVAPEDIEGAAIPARARLTVATEWPHPRDLVEALAGEERTLPSVVCVVRIEMP
jgi:hypothetical protein